EQDVEIAVEVGDHPEPCEAAEARQHGAGVSPALFGHFAESSYERRREATCIVAEHLHLQLDVTLEEGTESQPLPARFFRDRPLCVVKRLLDSRLGYFAAGATVEVEGTIEPVPALAVESTAVVEEIAARQLATPPRSGRRSRRSCPRT